MASSMVVSALLSCVFQVLFDRLASRQVISFFRRDQTLPGKLRIVLLTVHAVLIDAEVQQITNLRVKEWVNMLEDAVYRAEDLLDKIDTWQRKSVADAKVMGKSKVNGNEVRNKKIESKLTEIVEELDLLAKQRDLLNLKQSVSVKPPPMLPTTSLVNESEVFGRNNDKEELKRILLTADAPENRIPVIAIVGIGGVGKTTLAQLLYNDSEVKGRFHLRAWAYVSEEFDVFKVTRTIYESVTQRNCNIRDLNLLQIKLQKRLEGNRFLLILDNIWNEKFMDWDLLSKPLKNGASGGRIVVTTRNQHVAALMGAFFTYPLARLTDDTCWSLFAKHAFWSSNYDGSFKEIGEKIAKKCKGLPLAAKTLGGLLQSKKEEEEWLRILNSNIWDLPEDNSILPALQLSYYYLPSHLKRCFNYCSMFPKGYEFNKDRLILLWMAEGFLHTPIDKETMEQLGREYFDELLSRSFFQQLSGCFVMHDLINDLALFTSGEFYSKFEDGKPSCLLKKERHVVFLADKLDGPDKFRDSICKFKDLRTFLPLEGVTNTRRASGICSVFCEAWLPNLKHLRVLSLSFYAIIKLPDSLGELIHLRYLDLSQTLIAELPSSTCFLFNLQTLLLSGCRQLTLLPAKSLGLLINLRYFDLSQTEIRELPSSTCSLTNLQTLLLSRCHRLTALPEEIGRLSNIRCFDLSQTEITELPSSTCSLTNLQTLLLSKCHRLTVLPEEIGRLSNLRCFDLSQTEITELPSSTCSLTNLQTLLLSKCHRLTVLPEEIGRLSNLRCFDLSQTEITELPSSTCSLTNLQTLLLSKCHRLTVLPEEIGRLSNLGCFDLSQTEITELPSSTCSLTNLQTLLLPKCHRLAVLPEEIGRLSNLRCFDLSQTEITELPSSTWSLTNLQTLLLSKCHRLAVLPEEIGRLSNLRLDVSETSVQHTLIRH